MKQVETAKTDAKPRLLAITMSKVYELFETCQFGVCKRPCLAQYDGVAVPGSSSLGV